MPRVPVTGLCRVCGQQEALTREHVPPKASPNRKRYVEVTFEQALRAGPEDIPDGTKRQGGVWFQTLCSECNSHYCNRYNHELIRWYQEVAPHLADRPEGSGILTARNVYPLRLIKGFVAMFLTISSEEFRRTAVGEQMAEFVIHKDAADLPEGVSVYLYLNHTGELRYPPFETKVNLVDRTQAIVSEITYPPFGAVMTLNSSSPDERLFRIDDFAQYCYDDIETVELSLAILPTYLTLFACDYRTLGEI